MHSIFQISISRNTICAEMIDFRKPGHKYVFYITIVVMRDMRAGLLTLQNDILSQDSCYSFIITRLY